MHTQTPLRMMTLWIVILAVSTATTVTAGQTTTRPAPPIEPTTQPTTQPARWPTTMPSSQQIMNQLDQQIKPLEPSTTPHQTNPVVDPSQEQPGVVTNFEVPPTAGSVGVDPAVLGVAPGQTPPKLRREGEFIVNRRGRIVHAPNARHILFVFEADSDAAPESPMILLPSQMLENMESIIRDRGDHVVFILSGQILVYRGVNFMLPTMMRIAINRGNLEN